MAERDVGRTRRERGVRQTAALSGPRRHRGIHDEAVGVQVLFGLCLTIIASTPTMTSLQGPARGQDARSRAAEDGHGGEPLNAELDCDRTVMRQPQDLDEH